MKISIITPAFNSASTLEDMLKSVLCQTYDDYELIIRDGGSTDNTQELICRYEPLFKGKLKFLSEPDKGLYDAINKGIRAAAGDVVGILNSDDFYTSNDVLEKVVHTLSSHPSIDAVYGDVHFVNPDNLKKCVQ